MLFYFHATNKIYGYKNVEIYLLIHEFVRWLLFSFVLHFILYVIVWLAHFSFYIILYLFISLFSLFIHLQSHYVLRCGSDSCILIHQHVSLFCFSFRELIPSSFAVRTFENDGSEVIQEVDISYRRY